MAVEYSHPFADESFANMEGVGSGGGGVYDYVNDYDVQDPQKNNYMQTTSWGSQCHMHVYMAPFVPHKGSISVKVHFGSDPLLTAQRVMTVELWSGLSLQTSDNYSTPVGGGDSVATLSIDAELLDDCSDLSVKCIFAPTGTESQTEVYNISIQHTVGEFYGLNENNGFTRVGSPGVENPLQMNSAGFLERWSTTLDVSEFFEHVNGFMVRT